MSDDRTETGTGEGTENQDRTGSCGSNRWEQKEGERGRKSQRRRGRKERILHTRISEQLSEDIRGIAEELRVPVSNLVRNVLEEAFSAAERVTDDVGDILDEVMGEAERASHRIHRFREGRRGREAQFREQMEQAGEQVGRAAERFADMVDRMAQRARERAAERQARGYGEGSSAEEPGVPGGTSGAGEPDLAGAETATPSHSPESSGSAPGPTSVPRFDDVVAWQPVVLNTTQRCAATGAVLEPGSRAYMGIGAEGFTGRYVAEGAVPVPGQG